MCRVLLCKGSWSRGSASKRSIGGRPGWLPADGSGLMASRAVGFLQVMENDCSCHGGSAPAELLLEPLHTEVQHGRPAMRAGPGRRTLLKLADQVLHLFL